VEIDDGKFSVATNEIAIANSHGIDAAEKSTILYGYLICVAKEHGTASSMAFEYDVATSLADLSPELIGKQAAEKAIASLKPKAAKSFTGKVILDSDPAAEVIVSSIISSINADNVQRGRSLWAEKIGEKVASQKLTVSDDGLLPKGVGSSSFDSEGTPHQKTPIITRGKLEGFLYNSFTANKEKRKSTGSAYRESYSQLPSIGVSNLMIGAGKKKLEKIISEVDKGIVVRRFSGNIMHESGEFSGIAKQASYIEKGEIKYPLKETMISGNVFEAINHIIEVGSEIRPTLYRVYVPPILFDNINIVSK
jgi:PmbA protein